MPGSNVSLVIHKPFQATGLTSSNYNRACFGVFKDASIRAYPTSAGTATGYYSLSPVADCMTDIAAGDFITGVAKWTSWAPGAVSDDTTTTALGCLTCFVLVPANGTWTLEIVQ